MICPNEGGPIPQSDININDVLCGRGTKHCNQAGNIMYHTLVRNFIVDYAKAKKKNDKTEISKAIVDAIRNASPRGRFLNKGGDGLVHEIGDKKAWEKTSQLLRETVMMGNHRTMYQKRKWDQQRKKEAMSPMPSPVSVEQDLSICDRKVGPPLPTMKGVPSIIRRSQQVPLADASNMPRSAIGPVSSSLKTGPGNGNIHQPAHSNVPYPIVTYPYRAANHPPVSSSSRRPPFVVRPPPLHPVTYPLPCHSPHSIVPPMPNLQHPGAHNIRRMVSSGDDKYRSLATTNGPERRPHSCSYVDRLRTELSSWPVQPSPATIAELEVIARYQDATYAYNNNNAKIGSTRGPPLWDANH